MINNLYERRIFEFSEPFRYALDERGNFRWIDNGLFVCSCRLTLINLGETVIRELIIEHTDKGHLCSGRVRRSS